MSLRAYEPGWTRIGIFCDQEVRALWMRESKDGTLELCAGRDGDDAYVKIGKDNPQYEGLYDVLSSARFAAEGFWNIPVWEGYPE